MAEQSLGIKPHLFFCERRKYGSIAEPRMSFKTILAYRPFARILKVLRKNEAITNWLYARDYHYSISSFSIKLFRTRIFYVVKVGPYMMHFRRFGWDK